MTKIFDTFQLHRICLAGNAEVVEANIVADIAITLAYWAIPAVIILFSILKFDWHKNLSLIWWLSILALANFFFWCSMTHYMAVHTTIISPDYLLYTEIKQITALSSWVFIFILALAFWKEPLK